MVLSVVWYGGKLGAAYYETESAVMYFLLEALELDSFKLMESRKSLHLDACIFTYEVSHNQGIW